TESKCITIDLSDMCIADIETPILKYDQSRSSFLSLYFTISSCSIASKRAFTSSSERLCSFTYRFLGVRLHASVQPRMYLCSFSSEHNICLLHTGSAQLTYRSHGFPSK